jgi:acetyl-CoA carboxylase biotin carboxylase subunit
MQKVLVANRGEIACRVMSACRSLGLSTVAVYSEADANALHVASADAAVLVGPPPPRESYLKIDAILRAARESGADAVHPGYGFLAENRAFADEVIAAGLTWIGPAPQTITDMGDKERAREIAKAAGVPVVPGSARFAMDQLSGIEKAAEEIGYPVLVKAAAGGGGIGMRRVEREADLMAAARATQALAEKAFGDGTVYLEKFIARARHVEVQVFGFGNGGAVHLFERDCSIQRRFQKIIEESPAPGVPSAILQRMYASAVALCAQERYRGAGTIEFILDAQTNDFYFLEMNTRIQVEHPVTEMNTGVDLVGLQLQFAGGLPLSISRQDDVRAAGHAIECRIYAERPSKMFLPSPGPLTVFSLPPEAHGLRIDTGVREGDKITPHYDPMVAKVITHAPTRNDAIERMLAALAATRIEGIETNVSFLRRVLDSAAFRSGAVHTGFVDDHKQALLAA